VRRIVKAVAILILLVAAAAPALAADDWRAAFPVLRIGFVVSSSPTEDLSRLEPFRAYLAARIGIPVELVPSTDGAALIDAETSGRVAYAIDSAVGYVSAAAECDCVEPLAEPAAADGARGYYALLLARADGAIHDLPSAKDARLALTASDSVAGRLLPMKALTTAGIDPATYFSAIYESAGPEDAVAALLDGRVDIAAGWSSLAGNPATGYSFGVLTRMVADGRLSMDGVRVVWQSPLIPFAPHTVRKDIPPELRKLLLDALLAMATAAPDVLDAVDRTPYGGGGFVAASPDDYAPLAGLVAPL